MAYQFMKSKYNRLDITIVPIKQPQPTFKKKGEHYYGDQFIIKPDYIKIWQDDITVDVYKRIKNSCYWRIVGLKGYVFHLLIKLSM